MKQPLTDLLRQALNQLRADLDLPPEVADVAVRIERTRNPEHGDFTTNLAMIAAKPAGMPPRELAAAILSRVSAAPGVTGMEVAGPGFINIRLAPDNKTRIVGEVLSAGNRFGGCNVGEGRRVQVEFVSANPTGPLHVGHGRGAAYGSALCNLLTRAGFKVESEYYVNDSGRQMDILAASVWLRYLELRGAAVAFPVNAYRGDYIRVIAGQLMEQHGGRLQHAPDIVFAGLPADEPRGGDKEAHIDAVIARMRALLETDYASVREFACDTILQDIAADLTTFGCRFDRWFRESALVTDGASKRCIDTLREGGHLYERDGATWFRSTQFGDAKDRVVIRENGDPTYFATDIAYHHDKFGRRFDQLINIWGADHHGYVPRVRAALSALGDPVEHLTVLLVQFAALYRGTEKVPMSTRAGEFVTLRELRGEVGTDATRFFYLMHKPDQHMDFDLELAKSRSNDNPVYYVQYAHARICSVLRQAREKSVEVPDHDTADLSELNTDHETALLRRLAEFPDTLAAAARACEPHRIAYYLRDLANDLHTYYNAHQFLVDDGKLRDARLCLILAVRQVLANGLDLLGVSAPESM